MGEVWRARDTRLNRDVAIKFSSQQFTDRFEREVRAIAALNHSNICTLFDVGPNYLVMELIDGPTLADRIAEGPIPFDEALTIARQIADALEAAHEKQIIHRDLKPGNIKLRPDGSVKVLDFGLAKAGGEDQQSATLDSPTIMHLPTQAGVILGTAGYMSPEQARGQRVDKRADIFAFGVVLYELLTGERLFDGPTVSDTIAAVLTREPDLSKVPAQVRPLLSRCLAKNPRKRLHDIADYEFLLESAQAAANAPVPAQGSRLAWGIAALCLLIAAGAVFTRWIRPPAENPSLNLSIKLPPKEALRFTALSPDGRRLLIEGSQVYLRSLDSPDLKPLNTGGPIGDPFWSPDSRNIGYFQSGKLQVMPADGGPAQTLCDLGVNGATGGSWGSGGVIIFSAFGPPGSPVRVSSRSRHTAEVWQDIA
jgi:serine/threonine-protein kinase